MYGSSLESRRNFGETIAPSICVILLVDDDAYMLALMEAWVRAEGYRVRTACNGREAVRVLQAEVPCVMIVDLEMPIMDGAELRRRQQNMSSVVGVPFILISGESNANRVARELGIEEVIPKPFDAGRLSKIIATHCPQAH